MATTIPDSVWNEARQASEDGGADWSDPTIRYLVQSALRLSRQEPAIAIAWMHPRGTAERFMTKRGAAAVALIGHGAIVTPAITDHGSYAVCLHEIGHHRDGAKGSKLRAEYAAWRWAFDHAEVWTNAMHDQLHRSLSFSLEKGTLWDAAIVVDIERLQADPRRKPIEPAVRTFMDREFARQHGCRFCEGRLCASRRAGAAMARHVLSGRYLCDTCAMNAEIDASIARMRAQRTRSVGGRRSR